MFGNKSLNSLCRVFNMMSLLYMCESAASVSTVALLCVTCCTLQWQGAQFMCNSKCYYSNSWEAWSSHSFWVTTFCLSGTWGLMCMHTNTSATYWYLVENLIWITPHVELGFADHYRTESHHRLIHMTRFSWQGLNQEICQLWNFCFHTKCWGI